MVPFHVAKTSTTRESDAGQEFHLGHHQSRRFHLATVQVDFHLQHLLLADQVLVLDNLQVVQEANVHLIKTFFFNAIVLVVLCLVWSHVGKKHSCVELEYR